MFSSDDVLSSSFLLVWLFPPLLTAALGCWWKTGHPYIKRVCMGEMVSDVGEFCGWNILSVIHKLSEYPQKWFNLFLALFCPHPLCLAFVNRPSKISFAPSPSASPILAPCCFFLSEGISDFRWGTYTKLGNTGPWVWSIYPASWF